MTRPFQFAVVFLFSLFFISQIVAQDRQFTQFYASPLLLNPALTGNFDGKYRVGAVYRDQWRGILEQPYQSFAFGGDLRIEPFKTNFNKDRIGVGLQLNRDIVNGIDFSTTQIALSGAYHKSLNLNNTQYLSVGLQAGLNQRNINYETLSLQDQWNGIDGYTFPTQEKLPENNFSYTDFALGINYTISADKSSAFFVGAAIHHFNRPNISFYQSPTIPANYLFPRYTAHIAGQFPINHENTFSMSPRFLIDLQGPHLTANVGTNFKIEIDKTYSTALHFGSWLRPVRNAGDFSIDAVVFMAGLEYNSILFGASYDLNLPHLKKYSGVQNVFEISIIYLGDYENQELLCPTF